MITSLGLDTSSKLVGWGVVRGGDGELEYIDSGVIKLNENLRHPYRMLRFEKALTDILRLYKPTDITIEALSSVRNSKVARILQGYITMAVITSVRIASIEPDLLTLQTVMSRIGVKALTPLQKKQITGTKSQRSKEISRIGKSRIRSVINAQFDLEIGEKEQDRADALAVALAGLA